VGTGTQQKVPDQLAIFGTNRLYVVPGGDNQRGPGGTLTEADADLVRTVPNVAAAMPYLHGNVTLRYGNVDYQTKGVAITTDFPHILHWNVQQGLFFTADDERKLATVTVIGERIREQLFPAGTDPLGQFILVNNVPFQVIGVLASKGALSGDADDDDTLVFPFSTGSRRVYGKTHVSWISVLIDDIAQADATTQAITVLLEAHHRVRDFHVLNKAASIQAESETQQTMTLLLGMIAAISLLVGGIGVMNIMLMAVRERRREIGIRMATGARQRDILRQFLTEALLVSAIGGVAGMVIGLSIGAALIWWHVPIIFSFTAIISAFVCAVVTGLVFGYMPARQAARLDPVVALASE
jgi:macrolide transport system ATP-binding/permease protein